VGREYVKHIQQFGNQKLTIARSLFSRNIKLHGTRNLKLEATVLLSTHENDYWAYREGRWGSEVTAPSATCICSGRINVNKARACPYALRLKHTLKHTQIKQDARNVLR
jgi:hypothetical protein